MDSEADVTLTHTLTNSYLTMDRSEWDPWEMDSVKTSTVQPDNTWMLI